MNFSTLSLFTLLPFLLNLAVAEGELPSCTQITTRREWRMNDLDFRRRYIRAVKNMQDTGVYGKYPSQHYELNARIHGNAVFLPWHRYYIYLFEKEVKERDNSLHLPYWASNYDSQAPQAAPIWGDNDASFGLAVPTSDRCVRTGPFVNWKPSFPTSHCLSRTFGDRFRSFPSLESVNEALNRLVGFRSIAPYLEGGVHAYVHIGVGGDMSVMSSPNDPVFFLHHSNIDRLWYNWQKMDPSERYTDYAGYHYLDLDREERVSADSSYPLPGYSSIQVRDVLDSRALCVEYEELSAGENGIAPQLRPSFEQEKERIQESDLRDNSTILTRIKTSSPALKTVQGRGLIKLRPVEPLSDDWIKMNFLNATFVRENEARMNRIVESLNRIKGFISPSALWNRPDMFQVLVEGFKVRAFEATIVPNVTKFKATVLNTTDPAKTFVSLKSKIINVANKDLVVPWPLVRSQVVKVIGGKAVKQLEA